MNRIFTYICLILLGFGALQANGQAKAGKKPVKKGVLFPDVFFAGSTVANGPVKVKDLETMLRSKLQAHDSSGTSYKVLGFDFTYAEREICRHEVAALFQLNDILQSGFFENVNVAYEQKHSVIRMRQVSRQMIQIFCSADILDRAEKMAQENRCKVITGKGDVLEADVPDDDGTVYRVTLKQNADRYFDTSCACDERKFPLCVHKAALFVQTLKKYGAGYFQSMQNWDVQKNKLLEQYGYSLSDDLTNKFTFTYENGKPFLRVLDTTIQKVATARKEAVPERNSVAVAQTPPEDLRLGIYIDTDTENFPYVEVGLLAMKVDEKDPDLAMGMEKLELNQYINPLRFKDDEREILPTIRKFSKDELVKYLRKNLPFGDLLHDNDNLLTGVPDADIAEQAWEYLLPKYQKILAKYASHPFTYIKKAGKPVTMANLITLEFNDHPLVPQLVVSKAGKDYKISQDWILEQKAVTYGGVKLLNAALALHEDKLHPVENLAAVRVIEEFQPNGVITVPGDQWQSFLEKKVLSWSKDIHVHFAEELVERFNEMTPGFRLYLQERDGVLVIEPAFMYGNLEVKAHHAHEIIEPVAGVVRIIRRNEPAESEFMHMMHGVHTDIHYNKKEHYFHLSGAGLLANNWFYRFTDLMREKNVELLGYENLKNLRVSLYKPETQMHISSGIDWFDATIELTFGEEKIGLTEVKKALAHKQNYVKLADGSLGLLPEEWVKKYSLMLKMGDTKGNKVRLKKYHFSLLDEMLSEVSEENLQYELESKKEKLQNILNNDVSATYPPDHLVNILRPYQVSGFQWLHIKELEETKNAHA